MNFSDRYDDRICSTGICLAFITIIYPRPTNRFQQKNGVLSPKTIETTLKKEDDLNFIINQETLNSMELWVERVREKITGFIDWQYRTIQNKTCPVVIYLGKDTSLSKVRQTMQETQLSGYLVLSLICPDSFTKGNLKILSPIS